MCIRDRVEAPRLVKARVEKGFDRVGKGVAEQENARQLGPIRSDHRFGDIAAHVGAVTDAAGKRFRQADDGGRDRLAVVRAREGDRLFERKGIEIVV